MSDPAPDCWSSAASRRTRWPAAESQNTTCVMTDDLVKQRSPTSLPSPWAHLEEITEAAERRGLSVDEYVLRLHRAAQPPPMESSFEADPAEPAAYLETDLGRVMLGDSRMFMERTLPADSVDLIMTSPPYALVYKKDYGNEDADRYLAWFRTFMPGMLRVLKERASLVIDIGGAWKKGLPSRSLYHFELLVMLCREYDLHLCQEFYWYNPAKLPAPAEWVNVRRIRVKDAVNCVWWLSPSPFPQASNRRVLQPYSKDMERLIRRGYRHKMRPSGHNISSKFQTHNRGSIPPNLITLANNDSNGAYRKYCREQGLVEHPAQYPRGIPAYFIRMLTEPGNFVLDPFAGSCVTGEVAESMKRHWACCEIQEDYVEAARGRFLNPDEISDPTGALRADPYPVLPPCLSLVPEIECPLPEDGGESRPKTRKKGS